MLELKQITKQYKVGEKVVDALNGITTTFDDKELTAVLGSSGCGKTTLMNLIGGLDKATTGDLLIDGISTKNYKDSDWNNYRNHQVGFVFQAYNLIPHMTVANNVELALTLSGVSAKERKKRVTDALTKVGLGDQLYKKPNQMSGGQMQRVAIARALVNNPKILLADEPTGAVDTKTGIQIMEILKEVSKECLVLLVTHNQELADMYADRIIRMQDGLILSDERQGVPSPQPEITQEEQEEKLVQEAQQEEQEVRKARQPIFINETNKPQSAYLLPYPKRKAYIPPSAVASQAAKSYKKPPIVKKQHLTDKPLTDKQSVSKKQIATNKQPITNEQVAKQEQPLEKTQTKKQIKSQLKKQNKTNMSFITAIKLSFNNLWNKKGRSFITIISGAISVICIALILAMNSGFGYYINDFEKNNLSKFPIKVTPQTTSIIDLLNEAFTQDGYLDTTNVSINSMLDLFKGNKDLREKYTDIELVYLSKLILGVIETGISGFQNMDEFGFENEYDFLSEIFGVSLGTDIIEFMRALEENFNPDWGAVMRNYNMDFSVYRKDSLGGEYRLNPVDLFIEYLEDSGLLALLNISGGGAINALLYGEEIQELRQVFDNNNPWSMMIDDASLLDAQYDILAGRLPDFGTERAKNEIVLVVDEFNQLDDFTLFLLGVIDVESLILTVVNYIRPLLPPSADEMLDYFIGLMLPEDTEEIKLEYEFSDFVGGDGVMPATFVLRVPTDYYALDEVTGIYNNKDEGVEVEVVGILRLKENVSAGVISGAIGYTEALATTLINRGNNAPVIAALEEAIKHTEQLREALLNIVQRIMGTEFETDALAQIAIPQRVAILQELLTVAGSIEITEEQTQLITQIAGQLAEFELTTENRAVFEEVAALLATINITQENTDLFLQSLDLLQQLDPNEDNINAILQAITLVRGIDSNENNISVLVQAASLLAQLNPSQENITAITQAVNLLSGLNPSEENINAITQAVILLSDFDIQSENIQTLAQITTLLSGLRLSSERIDTIIEIVDILRGWDDTTDPEVIQEIYDTAQQLADSPSDIGLITQMARLLAELSSSNRELMLEALPLMLSLGLTPEEVSILWQTATLVFELDLTSNNLRILSDVAEVMSEFELSDEDAEILLQTAEVLGGIEISESDMQILLQTAEVLSGFYLSEDDMQTLIEAGNILATIQVSDNDLQVYTELINTLSQVEFAEEEIDTFVQLYHTLSKTNLAAEDFLALRSMAELIVQLDISEEEQAKIWDFVSLVAELEVTNEDIAAVQKTADLIQKIELSAEEQEAISQILALISDLEPTDITALGEILTLTRQINLTNEEQDAIWEALELSMLTLGFTGEDVQAVLGFIKNIVEIDLSNEDIDFILEVLPALSSIDISLGQTELMTQIGDIFKIRNVTVDENEECSHRPNTQHTANCAWFDSAQYNTLINSFDLRDIMRPDSVHIYPFSIESRNHVLNFITNFNDGVLANEELSGSTIDYTVLFTDELSEMTSSMSSMINTITYILIGVAAIAVVVAMLLVAIILYISVQDRTKEIGLLRSLGASKGNVSSVFIAETFIIGLVSGIVGVLLALALTFPANVVINSTLGISGLLRPVWWHQFALVGIAFIITVISGLIPASLAAKKDPVLALRTD